MIGWEAFKDMSEIDAVLHAQGVVVRRPCDLKALASQLFLKPRAAHRPRHQNPSPNAIRMREARERMKMIREEQQADLAARRRKRRH